MNRIEFGDCREILRRWAQQGVRAQTCVTSPPYFGLRDYGVDGQIGLERTPEEYVAKMVDVFRAVRDVLADDGTVWLNIGDSYAGGGYSNHDLNGQDWKASMNGDKRRSRQQDQRKALAPLGIKPKDLIGIPWMLAFALRSDGAASPAHMRDMEEMIAAVTASYASREQWPDRIAALVERLEREHIDANRGGWYLRQDILWSKPNPMPESVTDRCTKAHEYIFLLAKSERYFYDHEAMKEPAVYAGKQKSQKRGEFSGKGAPTKGLEPFRSVPEDGRRNRRSVWTVTTRAFKGAHFATFPPALIEPCILGGTSARGHCPQCGARWLRVVQKPDMSQRPTRSQGAKTENEASIHLSNNWAGHPKSAGQKYQEWRNANPDVTLGWRPTCECGIDPLPDVVLDPFMGSGTTAAVSLQHGRKYLGCELNAEYGALQESRIAEALGKHGKLIKPTPRPQVVASETDQYAAAAAQQSSLFEAEQEPAA